MTRARDLADLVGSGGSLPAATSIGDVSSTELGYLDGVSSALQAQIDSKIEASSGTFIPTLEIGGVTTGITYDTQAGVYYKLGNLIYWKIIIELTSKGAATGLITIGDLPQTPSNDFSPTYESAQDVDLWDNIAAADNLRYIYQNGTRLRMTKLGTGVVTSWGTPLTESDIDNDFRIRMSGVYLS